MSDSGIGFRDAESMDDDDLMEANAALDIKIEQRK